MHPSHLLPVVRMSHLLDLTVGPFSSRYAATVPSEDFTFLPLRAATTVTYFSSGLPEQMNAASITLTRLFTAAQERNGRMSCSSLQHVLSTSFPRDVTDQEELSQTFTEQMRSTGSLELHALLENLQSVMDSPEDNEISVQPSGRDTASLKVGNRTFICLQYVFEYIFHAKR